MQATEIKNFRSLINEGDKPNTEEVKKIEKHQKEYEMKIIVLYHVIVC
jgi:hypothetical protein